MWDAVDETLCRTQAFYPTDLFGSSLSHWAFLSFLLLILTREVVPSGESGDELFFLELATRGIKFLFDIPMVMYSSKLSVYDLHLPKIKTSPRKTNE